MRSKIWVASLLCITFVIIALFGAMTFLLDPLLQYGKESGFLSYRQYSEIYCNPGIAKNYEYNAVFLGSSMVENADVSEIDALFDCKTIKVPYSGASSFNHKVILDVCYRSNNVIDKVFWALDEYALTTDMDTPRYPLPHYLYDDDITNDLSYLLNLDIFYFYTIKSVWGTLSNQQQPLMRDGSWVEDENVYCKENALASIGYPLPQQENKGELYYAQKMQDNLMHNILPFVENHPETEFHFYMVPYSISYWYAAKQKGTLDAEIYIARNAVGELLKYDNVTVHFFQDDTQIITNLNNYKDYSHFKPEINSYMSKQMQKGTCIMTNDNYHKIFDDFYAYLTSFDYDRFYTEHLN